MPVALVVSDPTNVVGHSSSFVFNVPKGPPTVASVAVWVRAYESLIAQHGRISVMVVIRPKSSSRVTPEARDAIAKMANRLGPNIIGQATVVDAAGIYGTIVRTFMTGLNLISKTRAHQGLSGHRARTGVARNPAGANANVPIAETRSGAAHRRLPGFLGSQLRQGTPDFVDHETAGSVDLRG